MKKLKLSKFWRLSLGLLLFGVGQRLFYTGAVSPWAMDNGFPLLLILISLVSLLLGLLFLVPLIVWFYRSHQSDRRLLRLILMYLLSATCAGFVIGGSGQLLYNYTSFAYQDIRTGVWMISTIIQSILKLILCFGLVSIYKQLPIRGRGNLIWLPLVGVIMTDICLMLLNYWLPAVGSVFSSLVDAVVLIFTLYYFTYMTKEMLNEKIS